MDIKWRSTSTSIRLHAIKTVEENRWTKHCQTLKLNISPQSACIYTPSIILAIHSIAVYALQDFSLYCLTYFTRANETSSLFYAKKGPLSPKSSSCMTSILGQSQRVVDICRSVGGVAGAAPLNRCKWLAWNELRKTESKERAETSKHGSAHVYV